MQARIRIYTFRVQPLLCLGLEALFGRLEHCTYEGAFNDFARLNDALATPASGTADVLMLDFAEGFESYVDMLRELKRDHPGLHILFFLSTMIEDNAVVRALSAGVDGYLLQSATQEGVLRAVEAVTSGRAYLEPQVTPLVLAELRKPTFPMRETDVFVELSSRERKLIQLAADGLGNVEIADTLALSEKTVRNLWGFLFQKIGMNDKTQAVLWAIRTGQAELR